MRVLNGLSDFEVLEFQTTTIPLILAPTEGLGEGPLVSSNVFHTFVHNFISCIYLCPIPIDPQWKLDSYHCW